MDTIIKVISYITDYVNSIPTSSWVALGVLLGGSSIVTGVVAWINHRRLQKDLERLSRHMVNFLVIVLSGVVSFTGFIVLNGATFANFLGPWTNLFIKVIGVATVIYNFAKPSLQWFKDRQSGKAISNVNLPNLTPAVETINTAVPVQSFGTAAAGVDVVPVSAPPADIFNQ